MKKILPLLAYGTGAFLLFNYFKRKAAAGENLKFELLKVSIDTQKTRQANFFKIFYDVTINMINSETADVVVKDVNLNVIINGKNLGNLEQTLDFTVPRQSEKKVTFKASFVTLGALSLVKDLILKGLNFNVNINGYIDTDLGRVTINFEKIVGQGMSAPDKKKNFF